MNALPAPTAATDSALDTWSSTTVLADRPQTLPVARRRTDEVWQGLFAVGGLVLAMALAAVVLRGGKRGAGRGGRAHTDELES